MRYNYILVFSLFSFFAFAQTSLKHTDYDPWRTISNNVVSDSGIWVSWQSNPQKGDGLLYVVSKSHSRVYPRGTKQVFSPSERYLFFEVKPLDSLRRQAIKDEVSKKDRPQNSLVVARMIPNTNDTIVKIKDWQSSEVENDALAWRVNSSNAAKTNDDTDSSGQEEDSQEDKDGAKKQSPPKGVHPLYARSFFPSVTHDLGQSKHYALSRNGDVIVYALYVDSNSTYTLTYFELTSKATVNLLSGVQDIRNVAVSTKGFRVAAIITNDTVDADEANFEMAYFEVNPKSRRVIHKEIMVSDVDGFNVHKSSKLNFTHNAKYLFFGLEPDRPNVNVDTNLIDEDRAHVDVWTPFDPELQPRQLVRKSSWLDAQQTVVLRTKNHTLYRLPGDAFSSFNYALKQTHSKVIHTHNKDYKTGNIWTFARYNSYSVIDLDTEDEVMVHDSSAYGISLSPSGDWAYGYDVDTKSWYSFDISKAKRYELGADIPFAVHNHEVDVPNQYPPFGAAGFENSEDFLWIYDKHDTWRVDVKGKQDSKNLTNGRDLNLRFRYLQMHSDDKYVDQRTFFHGFHLFNRSNVLCSYKPNAPLDTLRHFPEASFYGFEGAKHRNRFVYRTGTFNEYPELYRFQSERDECLSNTNPQINDYHWGSVDFIDYVVRGDSLRGLLYTPNHFEGEKAPMIVYFYERNADNIYRHIIPTPSRSIINFPYYVSNGYAILVPDITYQTGEPGASALQCIMTAVDSALSQNTWIDSTKIALNGQSWGGYQSAWLITQTNRFAAAFSGAPVSNMTSAYGGIRWKSGHSRIMQYEEGQSRLGVPMHENLDVYIKNSPVFYTKNIQTPLLIMHNDNDGAVPWYQGIEMYMSMIRQQKDVWMLVYNNEEHNLTRWANRMDLSERVADFYDHYLKGKPAPLWMTEGVPVWRKGKVEVD
jgi:dienelactone hydrolase